MNNTNPSYKQAILHDNKDYDSNAEIRIVPRGEMPSRVEGFYRPMKHDITLPSDRLFGSPKDIGVRKHESVHAKYQTTNEYETDAHAMNETGHYELSYRHFPGFTIHLN